MSSQQEQTNLFPGFKPFNIEVEPNVTIHGLTSGQGPPLLLLHGFPQSHHLWHKITPHLISTFTVILIDLRGYGASSKPASTPTHSAYAKSAMAQDCVTIMTTLGHYKFSILAHDRGARVAHKLCVDHAPSVERCMLLDICPTLSMYAQTDQFFATAYWHWFFLIQPHPFPETLILGQPEVFRERFFGGALSSGGFHDTAAMHEYGKILRDAETVAGMCEDYRAAATVDLREAREDLAAGRKIRCPLRILWGKKGVIERCFDALAEWGTVCDAEVSGEAVDSGHYIAEEVPDVLLKHVKEFFIANPQSAGGKEHKI